MKTKTHKSKSKYKVIVALVVLLVLVAGTGYALHLRDKNTSSKQQEIEEQASKGKDDIDYSPPTDEEIEKNNRHKEDLAKNEDQSEENTSHKKSVNPQITYGEVYEGSVEVSSHVPGVFENSGTCKLVLTKGAEKIEKTKKAVPNVSEMSCGLIKISKSKFSKGDWKAVIEYSSSKAYGKSDSVVVEVN